MDSIDKVSSSATRNNFVEKYGHIKLVTASFHLLLYFLLKQLGMLTRNKEQRFVHIVNWANNRIGQITKSRDSLCGNFEDIVKNHPACGSSFVFNCVKKYDKDDNMYPYCNWYSAPYFVTKQMFTESTMTLNEAQCGHILQQICDRLNKVYYQIENKSNCGFDFDILSEIDKQYKMYDCLCSELNAKIEDVNNLLSSKSDTVAKTATIHREPTKPVSNTIVTGESRKEVPNTTTVSKPIIAATIKNEFSYASILTKRINQGDCLDKISSQTDGKN
jgi:hypothetical protein